MGFCQQSGISIKGCNWKWSETFIQRLQPRKYHWAWSRTVERKY